jgi:hypothetical protein
MGQVPMKPTTVASLSISLACVVLFAQAVLGQDAVRDVQRAAIKRDPLLYLPQRTQVVVSAPLSSLSTGRDKDQPPSPIQFLQESIVAHAILSALANGLDEPNANENLKKYQSRTADVERIVVGLWHRPADAKRPANDIGRTDWEGVLLLVLKENASGARWLRDAGYSRNAGARHPHVLFPEQQGAEDLPLYLALLSEHVVVAGVSPDIVEEVAVAGELPRREDDWKEYRPTEAAAEIFAARKRGTTIGGKVHDLGLSVAASADERSLFFTYLFDEGHVPRGFKLGAKLTGALSDFLGITTYGAAVTVKSTTNSTLTCEFRMDRGRGPDAAFATLLQSLGIMAFLPGEKSP